MHSNLFRPKPQLTNLVIGSVVLLASALGAAPAFETAASALRLGEDQQATTLLAQARQALGGEKLARVHGLTATGIYQREIGDRLMNGDLTLDLELPDKMLRTESMSPMPDATVVMLQGINGDRVLRNVRTPMGGPNLVMRMAPGGGREGGNGESAEQTMLRNQRAELTRLALAMLLTAPASMPLEYAYGGQAESADGHADVIEAKGPGSFAMRIFLDQQSHRPLMLTYRGVAPRVFMQTQRKDGGAGRGPEPPRPDGPDKLPPGAEPGLGTEPPQVVDMSVFLDDYKSVDGVLLPHHLSRSIDGKPNEDITFKTIKTNPAFKADAFSGK